MSTQVSEIGRRTHERPDESALARGVFVHEFGLCESANVGSGTRVWAFSHVLDGAIIGQDCNLGDGSFVEGGAVLGDRVVVKNGASVWAGVTLEDDVFAGPNVVFTNDRVPRGAVSHPGRRLAADARSYRGHAGRERDDPVWLDDRSTQRWWPRAASSHGTCRRMQSCAVARHDKRDGSVCAVAESTTSCAATSARVSTEKRATDSTVPEPIDANSSTGPCRAKGPSRPQLPRARQRSQHRRRGGAAVVVRDVSVRLSTRLDTRAHAVDGPPDRDHLRRRQRERHRGGAPSVAQPRPHGEFLRVRGTNR